MSVLLRGWATWLQRGNPGGLSAGRDTTLRHPHATQLFQYINYSDLKRFASGFKAIYNALNETAALSELETVKKK